MSAATSAAVICRLPVPRGPQCPFTTTLHFRRDPPASHCCMRMWVEQLSEPLATVTPLGMVVLDHRTHTTKEDT